MRSSWMGVLASLFGTIALVLAVNLAAYAYLQTYPVNRGVTRLWQKWHMLEALEKPYDWIVLGDSSCGQGLSEEVLSQRLGGSVGNFCTIANAGVVNDAWLLDRYVERFGPPRGVIVIHVFHVWDRSPADLVTMFDQIPLHGRFWNRLQPAIKIGPWQEVRFTLGPAMTLFEKNVSVSHVLQLQWMRLIGEAGAASATAWDDLAFVMRRDGFVSEAKSNVERVLAGISENKKAFGDKVFTMHPANAAALEAMVDLSKRLDFPLYVSNTSIAAPLYDSPGIRRYFAELAETIAPIVGRSPRARFILSEPPTFPPEQMDNIDHVVGEAALLRLSNAVADAVTAAR